MRQTLITKQYQNKTIIDSRLSPRCAIHDEYLLGAFLVEQNLIEISAVAVLAEVESS